MAPYGSALGPQPQSGVKHSVKHRGYSFPGCRGPRRRRYGAIILPFKNKSNNGLLPRHAHTNAHSTHTMDSCIHAHVCAHTQSADQHNPAHTHTRTRHTRHAHTRTHVHATCRSVPRRSLGTSQAYSVVGRGCARAERSGKERDSCAAVAVALRPGDSATGSVAPQAR